MGGEEERAMRQSRHSSSRRGVLQAGTALACGVSIVRAGEVESPRSPRSPALRVAHLTDMHVMSEKRAAEGYAAALQSLQKLDRKPDLLITGGDHVMDVWETPRDESIAMWDLYQKVLKDNCDLPVHPVIGNHDVFGYGMP